MRKIGPAGLDQAVALPVETKIPSFNKQFSLYSQTLSYTEAAVKRRTENINQLMMFLADEVVKELGRCARQHFYVEPKVER